MKRALITGITGQDGSLLARFLLDRDYEVFGGCRRMSQTDLWRLDALGIADNRRLTLLEFDATDPASANRLVEVARPDEIYNLAAQAHVGRSFATPYATGLATGLSVVSILEAVRLKAAHARILQASSSELFGNTTEAPQNENTPFQIRSPYGAAKLFGYSMVVNYAEAYALHASNVILFNHESPLRSTEFVTRKITTGVATFVVSGEPLRLGNLDAKRDWGAAREYIAGMWSILQAPNAGSWVLATGRAESIRRFVELSFATQHIALEWEGQGVQERAICRKSGKVAVTVDPGFYRPADVHYLRGDATKAARELDWRPSVSLEQIVEEMVSADLLRANQRPVRV